MDIPITLKTDTLRTYTALKPLQIKIQPRYQHTYGKNTSTLKPSSKIGNLKSRSALHPGD